MREMLSIVYHRLVALIFVLPFAVVRGGGKNVF